MQTNILKLSENTENREAFEKTKELFLAGQCVGIPTETVYGLAAWSGSEDGIARIYEAKGRPSDNPLIVHIWPGFELSELVTEVPENAKKLMDAYWPGPMTLVMKKQASVSDHITAGLSTVAVRMPAHPLTKALLSAIQLPLVAPSANTSGRPSPTTAEHVYNDLNGKIPLILDGGSCGVGLESTVIDVTGDVPMILRPGAITPAMVEDVCGAVCLDPTLMSHGSLAAGQTPKAPGMKYKHYAPKAKITVLSGGLRFWLGMLKKRPDAEKKWALLISMELERKLRARRPFLMKKLTIYSLGSENRPEEAAEALFDRLRAMDVDEIELVYAEALPETDIGLAVMNRLMKAAGGNLIKEQ